MNVELLQTSITMKREQSTTGIPFWCFSIDVYTRARIGSCNGGPGGCVCLGPQACQGYGPFVPGSWQSYSYSCCACGQAAPAAAPAVQPAPVVQPAPAVQPAPVVQPAPAVDPAPVAASADPKADCSANPACASLKLMGSCCPATDGTMLGCCSSSLVETEKTETNSTSVPAWCANLNTKEKVPPCEGSEATGCTCVGKSICGEGKPAPGSWQSYSTACCGCV